MTQFTTFFTAVTTTLLIFYFPIANGVGEESNALVFQGQTCTAILEEESLKDVLRKFQKETGIWFNVPQSELEQKISVRFENLYIKEGLRRILRAMNYSFLFDDEKNLVGVFVFGKTGRIRKATYPANLDEQMAKAVIDGDMSAVVELLARGADINAKGKYSGWTPLILAAKKGETDLVNLLLSHGADVNVKSNVRNRTPIMEGARNRNLETVKALLAANPEIDAVDWEGYTVLMFAAVSGQMDIVNVLLNHGANVNVKNKVGSSALTMASGYPTVFKKLKEAGAKE